MSLRPDEIVVGHVYRSDDGWSFTVDTINDGRASGSLGPRGRYINFSVECVANMAVADITQEEKANG